MNIEYNEHVKKQIIQNGIPVKDIEYNKVEKNGNVLIEGHYNNQQFRYMKPNFRQKQVRFENHSNTIPMQIVRMPNLDKPPHIMDSIQIYKRRMNQTRKKGSKKIVKGSRKKMRKTKKSVK